MKESPRQVPADDGTLSNTLLDEGRTDEAAEIAPWLACFTDADLIQIDGPFVLFAEDKTPVERWLSDYHTLRAYDASGARLEHMGFWSGDAGPYLPAVRGQFFFELDERVEASASFELALACACSEPERRFLLRRLEECR
ncbi:MAG TPA: hypothetical protein VMS12_04110, partial [Thermoanaerobaculia bacterium]|nr:hypothetical protein [Thermoanaerobaculia bacterium]